MTGEILPEDTPSDYESSRESKGKEVVRQQGYNQAVDPRYTQATSYETTPTTQHTVAAPGDYAGGDEEPYYPRTGYRTTYEIHPAPTYETSFLTSSVARDTPWNDESSKRLQPQTYPLDFPDIGARHATSYAHPRRIYKSQEGLSPDYVVRRKDYLKFYKVGKVFATLFTESVGEPINPKDSSVSEIAYGEQAHTKIRRFIVIQQHDKSCTCLPVTVYDPSSKKKAQINLETCGIIYNHRLPKHIEGITTSPVRLKPANPHTLLVETSIIDYAKPYTIEMNVKVKDFGSLDSGSKTLLLANFEQIFLGVFLGKADTGASHSSVNPEIVASDPSAGGSYVPSKRVGIQFISFGNNQDKPRKLEHLDHALGLDSDYFDTTSLSGDVQKMLLDSIDPALDKAESIPTSRAAAPGEVEAITQNMPSHLDEHSDSGIEQKVTKTSDFLTNYEIIRKPLRFFKIGRVFKTLWTEPAGGTARDIDYKFYTKVGPDELVYTKIRRFVVIRERMHSCLCLPLYTYGGQGTTKSDVRAQDHAVVYDSRHQPPPTSEAEVLEKEPFAIVVEDPTERINIMSRVNFAQVYTIQHNVKVAKVGRIVKDQLERLSDYFIKSITST